MDEAIRADREAGYSPWRDPEHQLYRGDLTEKQKTTPAPLPPPPDKKTWLRGEVERELKPKIRKITDNRWD